MIESEMVKHIKLLTKVIEKQAQCAEQMNSRFASFERLIAIQAYQIGILQGMREDE